jgi:GNAT superfamily N-acetyltransferase
LGKIVKKEGCPLLIKPLTLEQFHQFCSSLDRYALHSHELGMLEATHDFLRCGETVYGALLARQVAGVIRFGEEDFVDADKSISQTQTLIGIIFVHPFYRGQDIGRKLVEYAMRHTRTCHLLVDPADRQAEQFFLRCGFQPNEKYDLEHGGDWLLVYSQSSL